MAGSCVLRHPPRPGSGGAPRGPRCYAPHLEVRYLYSALLSASGPFSHCTKFVTNAASSARLSLSIFCHSSYLVSTYFYLLCRDWETADSNAAQEQNPPSAVPQAESLRFDALLAANHNRRRNCNCELQLPVHSAFLVTVGRISLNLVPPRSPTKKTNHGHQTRYGHQRRRIHHVAFFFVRHPVRHRTPKNRTTNGLFIVAHSYNFLVVIAPFHSIARLVAGVTVFVFVFTSPQSQTRNSSPALAFLNLCTSSLAELLTLKALTPSSIRLPSSVLRITLLPDIFLL